LTYHFPTQTANSETGPHSPGTYFQEKFRHSCGSEYFSAQRRTQSRWRLLFARLSSILVFCGWSIPVPESVQVQADQQGHQSGRFSQVRAEEQWFIQTHCARDVVTNIRPAGFSSLL
jgi:hypothetical protein